MKLSSRTTLTFLTLTAGALALLGWSSRIGRRVWSPRVFAWRNPLKPQPSFEEQEDCPACFINPRAYSFMSIGSSVGTTLKIDLKNLSDKAIHSFMVSYFSEEISDSGGMGIQPEEPLQPKQFCTIGTRLNGNKPPTFSVDFIQFADGDVWFANPPKPSVKPEGVQAGAEAAKQYLREVLESEGSDSVMNVLPHIRRKMGLWRFSEEGDFDYSGFNCGITKTVVSVQNSFQTKGLTGVRNFLLW